MNRQYTDYFIDVGGGSVSNDTRYSLARISLRWMVRECFKTGTGIMFDADRLCDIGLDPTSLYPFVIPRPLPLSAKGLPVQSPPSDHKLPLAKRLTKRVRRKSSMGIITATVPRREDVLVDPFKSEEMEDLADALSPKYDQLKFARLWWALEVIPMKFKHQVGDGKWISWFGYVLIAFFLELCH